MTEVQLLEAFARGEQRHIEFKADGPLSDADYRARVIRAMLGMANRRDGGSVVLGVDDKDPTSSSGMSGPNVVAWTKFDDVADQVARYADPSIEFTITTVVSGAGTYVVLDVEEFREVPVLCKKAYHRPGGDTILRHGALYVRSSAGRIETREVSNPTEMRALIELASEKRLRGHIEMTARAGGVIVTTKEGQPVDVDVFNAELGDLA